MTPENINYLESTSFKLLIEKIPNVQFFCKGVSIPTITVNEANVGYRQTSLPMLADKLTFDSLTVSILVDEDMKAYTEVFDWIKDCTLNSNDISAVMSDISVVVTNSHNNKTKTFTFHNAFPTSVGSLDFDSSATATTYLTSEVTFRFSNMTLD